MCKFLSFTALCLLSYCVLPTQSSRCYVDPSKDFHERTPLILEAHFDEFSYPNDCSYMLPLVSLKTRLRIACPNDIIHIEEYETTETETVVRCNDRTNFINEKQRRRLHTALMSELRCNHAPKVEVRTTTRTCGNGMISKVGFAVSNSSFVPTIEEVCRHGNQSYWTHHKVVPGLTCLYNDSIFGEWKDWFPPGETTTQKTTITGFQIIDTPLVPREDMFYRAQQESTFVPINTVPMHESIANGNWRSVEHIVRNIANKKELRATLDVWTGRYGPNSSIKDPTSTTTVSSTSSTAVGSNSSTSVGNRRMSRQVRQVQPSPTTTPDFVFKMVVDKQHHRGIVFVTSNDPTYFTVMRRSKLLCMHYFECSKLHPQFNVLRQGYTYCCTLDSFARVAEELGIPTTFRNYRPLI